MIILKLFGVVLLWLIIGCLAVKIFTKISLFHFDVIWFTIILIFAPATFILSVICLIIKFLYDVYSGK